MIQNSFKFQVSSFKFQVSSKIKYNFYFHGGKYAISKF